MVYGKGGGEGDDAADLVGGVEPAVVAVAGVHIGRVAGVGEVGHQNDAAIDGPRRPDGLGGDKKAVLLIDAVKENEHKGGEKGFDHLSQVGKAQGDAAHRQHMEHKQRQIAHQQPGIDHGQALPLKLADEDGVQERRRHEQSAHHHPGGDGMAGLDALGGEDIQQRLADNIDSQYQHEPIPGKFLYSGADRRHRFSHSHTF